MTSTNLYRRDRAGSALAAQAALGPSVSLRSYLRPVDGIALASFNVVYSGAKNPAATASAIEQLMDNDVTVVPGSLREVSCASNGVHSVITARLTGKTKKLFVETGKTPEGFTAVSKNLFMDGEDKMWDLQTNGGRTVLVRKDNVEGCDALDSLLSKFAPVTASTIKAADELIEAVHALASNLETGTLVSYVQPANRQVKLGFVLECSGDKATVVPEIGAVEDVPLSLITNGFNANAYAAQLRQPKAEAIAADSISTREALISYYRQVYGMNEAFFAEWTKALQQMSL